MKKYAKWVGIVVFTPFVLILLLAVLLYLPPVQNWAVKQVASYASESTGMDISVEHVQLVFPLKLGVEGVKVLQPVDSLKNSRNLALRNKKDTVADIQKMVVDVQLLPLFSNQVMVDELNFTKMKVNTTNFIHEARIKGDVGRLQLMAHGIDLGKEHVNVNDALISDGIERYSSARYDSEHQLLEDPLTETETKEYRFYPTHAWRYPSGECLFR